MTGFGNGKGGPERQLRGAFPPFGQGVANSGSEPLVEDTSQPRRHKFHKFWLHEFKTVWNVQADESLSV